MATEREGNRLLDRFLLENRISIRKAGAALGVTHVTVNEWRAGRSVPGDDALKKAIETWTGGAVPFESWFTASELIRRRELDGVSPFKAGAA